MAQKKRKTVGETGGEKRQFAEGYLKEWGREEEMEKSGVTTNAGEEI